MDLDVVLGDRNPFLKARVSVGRDLDRHIPEAPKVRDAADLGAEPGQGNCENKTNEGGFPHQGSPT